MKLAVFWPWDSPFTFTDFTETMLALERPPTATVKFFRGTGWCSARRHTDGYEQSLEWGAEVIVCLGADQVYPPDLLPRLLARHEETGGDAIAALVPFRGYVAQPQPMRPFQPIAWRIVNQGTRVFRGIDHDPDLLEQIDPEAGELQRVHIIGTGVLLLHRDHLARLTRPWFYNQVHRESLRIANDMDAQFVWRLQTEARVRIWVDTTLDVHHDHVFPIDRTFQHRFPDWRMAATTGSA